MFSADRKIANQGSRVPVGNEVAEFPTGVVDTWTGIFLSQFIFSHAIKKSVPYFLVAHTEMPEQNGRKIKKSQQNKLILIPKCSFYFNEINGYSHLMFLFTYKEVKSIWKFELAFHNLMLPTVIQ